MTKDFCNEEQRKDYIEHLTKELESTFKVCCSWNEQKKELTIELTPVVSLPMTIYTSMLKVGFAAKKEYVFTVKSVEKKIVITIKNK